MHNKDKADALYVYGIVKAKLNTYWKKAGIDEENVYTINEGDFSAFVHECEEKPYISKDPNKIKELIIAHNNILDIAMQEFNGVIPLHFNTIIKRGTNTARFNIVKWLDEDKERLEKIWDKVKGKKEYGIRIYYDKAELLQEASNERDNESEVEEIEKSTEGKGEGLSYLLQSKAKAKAKEIAQQRFNDFKKKFYEDVSKITDNVIVNKSRIIIEEDRDLLITLSVLADSTQISEIKKILKPNDFSFQFAGPFAPYSFVQG